MKKVLLGLFSLFMAVNLSYAQPTGSKALKKANRALGSFNIDPANNSEKLLTAKELIDVAMQDAEMQASAKAWLAKGEIYNEFARYESQMLVKDPKYKSIAPTAAFGAHEAFEKALGMAEKKYRKKDALKGMLATITELNNLGAALYGKKDFAKSHDAFSAVLDIHKVLKENDMKSVLDLEDDMNNQLYITGVSALYANKLMEAKPHLKKLYDAKYDKPAVYEGMFKIALEEGKEDEAVATLTTGRELFPDDLSLLYAEINYYLKAQKMEVLVDKLKGIIAKDPDNVALYATLGQVYDKLYQKAEEAGNEAEAKTNFDNALSYYEQALAKDDQFFNAMYSIGALYYNKAANIAKGMKALEDDYSKAGMRKYEAKKAEVFAMFDKALPSFQKAEALNPNDINTLSAIKEIYAKKDNLEMTNEFKARIENVQAGKSNEAYYKN